MIFLMNMMMKNDGFLRQASDKDLKRKSDEGGNELFDLLKKTQTEVNTLENELKKSKQKIFIKTRDPQIATEPVCDRLLDSK